MFLAALCLLPALSLAPLDTALPFMTVQDQAFGTSAPSIKPPSNHLGLVPGHTVRFQLTGGLAASGGLGILGLSSGMAPTPLPLGSGLLLIDPVGLQVLATSPLDGSGNASFDLVVPAGLPTGMSLATQGMTIDPLQALGMTGAFTHAISDLQPVVLENFFKSNHPSAGAQSVLVISDPTTWYAFYAQHKSATVTPPAVDFSKQVVVVGFGGHFITLGYTVQIDELVPLVGGGLEVRQTVFTPGVGCGTLPSESKPGQIVAVDRVAGASPVVAVTTVKQGAPCP